MWDADHDTTADIVSEWMFGLTGTKIMVEGECFDLLLFELLSYMLMFMAGDKVFNVRTADERVVTFDREQMQKYLEAAACAVRARHVVATKKLAALKAGEPVDTAADWPNRNPITVERENAGS